jgi:hypothetical protein
MAEASTVIQEGIDSTTKIIIIINIHINRIVSLRQATLGT